MKPFLNLRLFVLTFQALISVSRVIGKILKKLINDLKPFSLNR